MQNRTPAPRSALPPLPDFTPVPRQKVRHDGWTPARQKAFIEALADTGSVSRAAAMVNMAQTNCYTLRRAPGAEGFRRAWDAALDFGVQRLKDIAFERAIDGELIPVFVAGKLMGFRRKRNDKLLMFCLRHYGRDPEGRRTTINYFSTRASAGIAGGEATGAGLGSVAAVEAATTTMRTVVSDCGGDAGEDIAARADAVAHALGAFDGVALDHTAQHAIMAALEDCAARRRANDEAYRSGGEAGADAAEGDPAESFVRLPLDGTPYRGVLEPPGLVEDAGPQDAHELPWSEHGADMADWVLSPPPTPPATVSAVARRPPRRRRATPA